MYDNMEYYLRDSGFGFILQIICPNNANDFSIKNPFSNSPFEKTDKPIGASITRSCCLHCGTYFGVYAAEIIYDCPICGSKCTFLGLTEDPRQKHFDNMP